MIRQVHEIIRLFLSGVSGSCTTLFSYPWARIPQSTSGVSGPRIPFTQPSFEGMVCRPLPTIGKDGVTTFLVYTRSRRFLVYSRSRQFLVYTRSRQFLVYKKGKRAIHTSVRGVVGASWAGITLKSDSWAVCAGGAWATEIHAFEVILGSE